MVSTSVIHVGGRTYSVGSRLGAEISGRRFYSNQYGGTTGLNTVRPNAYGRALQMHDELLGRIDRQRAYKKLGDLKLRPGIEPGKARLFNGL